MNRKTDYVVGKKTDTTWAGVYGYKPTDPADYKRLGEMFSVFRFETSIEEFAIDKFAKIVIESLQNSYFEELKDYKSSLERLEESCWKMKSKMDLLLSREEEVSNVGIDIEMAIVVFKDNYLYVVTIGESKVFINREENFVDITDGLADRKNTGFLRSASLEVDKNDRFALATSKASTNLLNLEDALKKLDKEKLIESGKQDGVSFMMIADEESDWAVAPKKEPNKTETKEEDSETEESNLEIYEEKPIPPSTIYEEKVNKDIHSDEEQFEEVEDVDQEEDLDDQIDEDFDESEELEENDNEEDLEEEPSKIQKLKERSLGILGSVKDRVSNLRKKDKDFEEDDEYEEEYLDEEDDRSFSERKEKQEEEEKISKIAMLASIVFGFFGSIINAVKNHFKDNKKTYAHIINTIYSRIASFVGAIKNIFQKEILGQNLDRRSLNKRRVKRNRYLFIIGIAVIFIGGNTVISNGRNREKIQDAVQSVETKIEDFDARVQGISTEVINLQYSAGQEKDALSEEIISLRENILIEIDNLEENKLIEEKSGYFETLRSLSSQLSSQADELMLVESFIEPQIVADLSRQFDDSQLSDLEYSEGSLFAADEGRDVIYKLGTNINSEVSIHITEVLEPYILVRSVNGGIIVYDKSDDAVIGRFNPNDKESLARYSNLIPPSVGGPTEAAIYDGNDALYEIHQVHQQIFKRDKTANGYVNGGATFQSQNPPNWKQDPELSNAVDIEVPYEIYVLTENLGIRRYLAGGANTLGREVYINLLDSDYLALQGATALDVNLKYMAVGDSVNRRVMLFEVQDNEQKNIRFIKQFQYRGDDDSFFRDINEIVIVNESLFVLDGNKIVRLDI